MSRRNQLAAPWWLLPLGRVHPLWWTGVGAGWIGIDYLSGPASQFPVLFVVPVSLAAWYSGRRPALALAVAIPLAHLLLLGAPIAATIFRSAVVVVLALWFARLSEHERELNRHVQRLEGLLPICCFCKAIRTEAGVWEPLEVYISERSEAQFSHGFCPRCGQEHYPEMRSESASRSS